MDKDFFVKIADPLPLRVSLLHASKFSLVAAKCYLDLQEIRRKKTVSLTKVSKQISDLNSSFEKLLFLLPHKELMVKETKKREPKKKSSKAKAKYKKKSLIRKPSEIERINLALAAIEDKINDLT